METKSINITWHHGDISSKDREQLLKQTGVVIWFTGLSGSGKSTQAVALEKALYEGGHLSYRLDGDNIRHGINADLGFSPEDRTENIRRIGEIARLFADAGLITMSSFISPYRKDRDAVRALLAADRFIEVYMKASLEVCEERDPKGLYKKARAGEIQQFTGIDAPYEEPENADIVLDSDTHTVAENTELLMQYLRDRGVIPVSAKPND